MEVVLDTSVVIGFLRAKAPEAAAFRSLLQHHRVYLTAVTGFELEVGLSTRANQSELVEHILEAVEVLSLDVRSARRAGREEARLRREGVPIGMADVLIAGICLEHQKTLVTANAEYSSRVEGMQVLSRDRGGGRATRGVQHRCGDLLRRRAIHSASDPSCAPAPPGCASHSRRI